MKHVVIIGNGVAGITAARHLRKKSDFAITVVSSESEFFFSRTALMYVYMGDMEWRHIEPYEKDFWKKNRINLRYAHVDRISIETKKLVLSDGATLDYDELILGTGSKYKKPEIPGVDCKGIFGMYSKQDFDGILEYTKGKKYRQPKIKKAVILGGGLIGIELAEMLIEEGIHVTMIIRDHRFYSNVLQEEESEILENHIRDHHLSLVKSSGIKEVYSENGTIKKVELLDGQMIETDFLGLTIGVTPNVDWLRASSIEVGVGVLVNEYLQTNIESIYAIGDCAEQRLTQEGRKPIEPVWYTGRMMGECVAANIVEPRSSKYNPGIWFNSAKFFDIEYQIYGNVSADSTKQSQFFWKKENAIVRAAFDKKGRLEGLQSLVVRIRHEVAEEWIKNGVTKDFLNDNFEKVLFDPEFSLIYKEEIQF